MYLIGLGLIFVALKYLSIGAVAEWDWWQVLIPFALAVLWWAVADRTGYTRRKAEERMRKKSAARVQAARDNLMPGRQKR